MNLSAPPLLLTAHSIGHLGVPVQRFPRPLDDKLQPDAAARPQGYVESLTRRGARGWAWIPAFPEMTLKVEAVLDGKVVGRAVAENLRQDLLTRSFGTGRYGFVMTFNEEITGDRPPTIGVVEPDDWIRLPGKYEFQKTENPGAAVSAQPTAVSSSDGYVDKLTRHGARGWAWLPTEPLTVVEVEAELEGKIIGRARADGERLDLVVRGLGTGKYGFTLFFNGIVYGDKAPVLYIAGQGNRKALPGAHELPALDPLDNPAAKRETPAQEVRLQPLVPEPQGHVDSISRQGARGWAWLPSLPEATLEVEAVYEGRIIGRASADGERPDLLKRGFGTGRYGFAMSFEEMPKGDRVPTIRVLMLLPKTLPGANTLPPPTTADLANLTRGTMTVWSKEHSAWTSRGPHYEEFDDAIVASVTPRSNAVRPLIMAFYLPQFHAIPENNEFWGTGFTEWRQLTRGVSRFPGHYQPRIPRDLGFYDLTNINTLRAQSVLAKAAGVNAFSFYYYWFNGKRLLERPLDLLLSSDVDMPFTILWANENWTRTWDGSDSAVLVRQDYRDEDENSLLADLARHFKDSRYVRLDGRPLFFIYNPANIPDTLATVRRWRNILASVHKVEPFFFMAQTFGARDPKDYGFDGAMEFPPHKTAEQLVGRLTPDAYSSEYRGHLIAYDDFVAASLGEKECDYHLIKTAVPSWDNESRRPNRGLTLEGLSPTKYEAWLRELLVRAIKKPIGRTPIVAINAWNEWAEAAYLEPDVHFGASYLNATARAYASALKDTTVIQFELFETMAS